MPAVPGEFAGGAYRASPGPLPLGGSQPICLLPSLVVGQTRHVSTLRFLIACDAEQVQSPPRLPATPPASSDATRRAMSGNRSVDTAPELLLRRLLHSKGLRFRKDYRLPAGSRGVKADIVFARQHVAVFVDGCFWHGCPDHCRMPTSNRDYWESKIARNKARDLRNDAALIKEGWRVIRMWEHVPVEEAARSVMEALQS